MALNAVGDGEQPPIIDLSVIINRTAEEVFAFTDNITTEGTWRGELVESEQLTDGPVGVGTQGRTLWRFMGRTVESTWEITEYEPDRIVRWRSLKAPTHHMGQWTYEAVEDGTMFRFTVYPAGPTRAA